MKNYKKILLILFLFFVLLLFDNTVNASYIGTDGVTYPDIPSTYTDNNFFILHADVASHNLSADTTYLYVMVEEPYRWGEGKYLHVSRYGYLNYYAASDNYYTGECDVYYLSDNNWVLYKSSYDGGAHYSSCTMLYSTLAIYDTNWSAILFEASEEKEYISPYIADTDEVLTNLDDVEEILIFPGSLSKSCLPINFKINKYTDPLSDKELMFELSLDSSSPYYLYIVENPDDYWWEVPTELFKNSLENGSEYHFILSGTDDSGESYSISRSITYSGTTYVPPTDEEIQTDAINNQTQKIEEQTDAIKEQTEKIEEQTEVNKSIFARIGEILSYINPLSENFFAYKLIDLLVDALKSLFVPEDGFLGVYFDDLFDWFCDRLGFLSYPLELILNILDKILNINFAEPVINIPEIKEPVTGQTFISATSYNFNSLLENETLANVHNIYLIVVDAILAFAMVNLLKKKLEEVTSQ